MKMRHPTERCPRCGRELPPDAATGSCPRCLLAAGLSGSEGSGGAADLEAIAELFPGLELLELRGQGGMGLVYKAHQKKLDRLVALKVLLPEVAAETGFADRFLREARTMARLQHPHIVGVYEFGETDGLYYLIMEYVDGPTLRQVLNTGELQAKEALAIVPQVCDALQYAHEQGVVHRDIKPENILLTRAGTVKIADFGLAKLLESGRGDPTLTRAGQVMGTLHYMAPEQYQMPNSVDHRADIFSLGVVFYEMLTGQLPLGRFDKPSEKVQVDVRLDQVVLRALEQERDRRYQHASEVGEQVDSIAAGPVLAAAPAPAAPYAAPVGGPRTSRLAVWSFVLLPISLVCSLIVALVMPVLADGDSMISPAAKILGSVVIIGPPLLSVLFAIISLVRIPLSNGRLKGLGWAITTLVLGGFFVLVVGSWFLVAGASYSEAEMGATVDTTSGEEVPANDLLDPELPVTGPGAESWSTNQQWLTAHAVLLRWNQLGDLFARSGPDLAYEHVRDLYGPRDQDRLDALDEIRRDRLGQEARLGLPLSALNATPVTYANYEPSELRIPEEGRARLILTAEDRSLEVLFVRDENQWYFQAMPVGGLIHSPDEP